MKRRVIHIDEEKCTGCGLCVHACHEGAIGLVGGKARLMRDDYCDGLGDCLPACPEDAITFVEREAAAYDEAAVIAEKMRRAQAEIHASMPAGGCPGSMAKAIVREAEGGEENAAANAGMHGAANSSVSSSQTMASGSAANEVDTGNLVSTPLAVSGGLSYGVKSSVVSSSSASSFSASTADSTNPFPIPTGGVQATVPVPARLGNWPIQIKLAPVNAPYFQGGDLLVAADCTAFVYGAFHEDFLKGRVCLIGCPKLDGVDYTEKLAEIIAANNVRSVRVARMQVPCCGGIEQAARRAVAMAGGTIPVQVDVISSDGRIVAVN